MTLRHGGLATRLSECVVPAGRSGFDRAYLLLNRLRPTRHVSDRRRRRSVLWRPSAAPSAGWLDHGESVARYYTQKTLMKLAGKSRLYCAKPECGEYLLAPESPFDPEALLTNIAHIEGSSDDGPRPNPVLTPQQRDDYENLVLLCPTHHTMVDKQDSTYTVEELRRWKDDLEAFVDESLSRQMKSISFSEMQTACDAIIADNSLPSTPLRAVPPSRKMEFNDLHASETLIRSGLMQESQVISFIQQISQLIPDFPTRLRQGFVVEYERLRGIGLNGDDLFTAMFAFAGAAANRSGTKPAERFLVDAAALAVLAHLFHICDVFEVPPDVDA